MGIVRRWVTYESSTLLMNWRMGMNVDLVLELASANKKDVAADTGAAKSSYSSTRTTNPSNSHSQES
jgi:hypothetical protein